MIIKFDGIEPQARYYRMGVMLNNLTDDIVFELTAKQGDIDLTAYRPYLKLQTPDLSFADKDGNLEATPTDDGKLRLRYKITRTLEQYHTVDMQLQFEDYSVEGVAVWQSTIFNVTFNATLPVDQTIEKSEPTILQDHARRITSLEDNPNVQEYASHHDFPSIGLKNTLYVDKESDTVYRFDEAKQIYNVVGTDYSKINLINGNFNGGN